MGYVGRETRARTNVRKAFELKTFLTYESILYGVGARWRVDY